MELVPEDTPAEKRPLPPTPDAPLRSNVGSSIWAGFSGVRPSQSGGGSGGGSLFIPFTQLATRLRLLEGAHETTDEHVRMVEEALGFYAHVTSVLRSEGCNPVVGVEVMRGMDDCLGSNGGLGRLLSHPTEVPYARAVLHLWRASLEWARLVEMLPEADPGERPDPEHYAHLRLFPESLV